MRLWPDVTASAPGQYTTSLRVLYDCEAICQRTRDDPGDMAVRRASRCSLPGFDPATWDPDCHPDAAAEAERLAFALVEGAEACGVSLDFDLDRHGCPWGWADSAFARSVSRYTSPRALDSPVRGQNLALLGRVMRDPEEPTRLLDWARFAEAVEDAAFSRYHEVRAKL